MENELDLEVEVEMGMEVEVQLGAHSETLLINK